MIRATLVGPRHLELDRAPESRDEWQFHVIGVNEYRRERQEDMMFGFVMGALLTALFVTVAWLAVGGGAR